MADLLLPDAGVYVREGLEPATTYKFTQFVPLHFHKVGMCGGAKYNSYRESGEGRRKGVERGVRGL